MLISVVGHTDTRRRWAAQLSFSPTIALQLAWDIASATWAPGKCSPSRLSFDSASVLRSSPSMDHGAQGPPETNLALDPYFTSCYLFVSRELFSQIVSSLSSSAILLSLIKTNVISRNNTGFIFNKHNLYSPAHPFSTDNQPFSYSPSRQPTHRNKCFRGGCRGWYF